MEKKDQNVRFHAMQALIISAAYTVLYIVLIPIILNGIILRASFDLWLGIQWISNLLWLGYIVLMIVLAVQASQGKRVRVPVAGDIAERKHTTFMA